MVSLGTTRGSSRKKDFEGKYWEGFMTTPQSSIENRKENPQNWKNPKKSQTYGKIRLGNWPWSYQKGLAA